MRPLSKKQIRNLKGEEPMVDLVMDMDELNRINATELFKNISAGKAKKRIAKEAVEQVGREIEEWAAQERLKKTINNFKDDVNHPDHYTSGGIETIDYMEAKSTPEEFRGHLRLTTIKYLSRAGLKDDTLTDLKKAQWYLNRLIEFIEKDETPW